MGDGKLGKKVTLRRRGVRAPPLQVTSDVPEAAAAPVASVLQGSPKDDHGRMRDLLNLIGWMVKRQFLWLRILGLLYWAVVF